MSIHSLDLRSSVDPEAVISGRTDAYVCLIERHENTLVHWMCAIRPRALRKINHHCSKRRIVLFVSALDSTDHSPDAVTRRPTHRKSCDILILVGNMYVSFDVLCLREAY